ncbi:MAG: Tad domain-containing protein [Bdellovibrionaceae bacterium]|nr:Tad domain-containing protein [Pseudobdellovibrionaceae bacterium]
MSNHRGQVAIFVVLMFQVLFLMFAMVVNVGLLVHHKINLQNSVDLAAYYAATKQAELLNVIAHANYQIRQAWKLLVWRYRVLGSAGNVEFFNSNRTAAHPYANMDSLLKRSDPSVFKGYPAALTLADIDFSQVYPQGSDYGLSIQSPALCLSYEPFDDVPSATNFCQEAPIVDMVRVLRGVMRPNISASFIGAAHIARSVSAHAAEKLNLQCRFNGTLSYVTLARFISGFGAHTSMRKSLIASIGNTMSYNLRDFEDIDGESVFKGAKETLIRNLTEANRKGLQASSVRLWNSLATSDCGLQAGGMGNMHSDPLPKWLKDMLVYPIFAYLDSRVGQGSLPTCEGFVRPIVDGEPWAVQQGDDRGDQNLRSLLNLGKSYNTRVQRLLDLQRQQTDFPITFSLGVEKNPWCMAYVGFRAEAEPRIPFGIGKVRLKAQAFAKPFGASIGPSFGSQWLRGSDTRSIVGPASNKSINFDPLAPTRFSDPSLATLNPREFEMGNYSRYVGDTFGLRSTLVLGWGARAIAGIYTQLGIKPKMSWWELIDKFPEEPEVQATGADYLALRRDTSVTGPDNNPIRRLELTALAPDHFDITFYTIDPDFMINYGSRLERGLIAKGKLFAKYRNKFRRAPGDFGYHAGADPSSADYNFSVRDQINLANGTYEAPARSVMRDPLLLFPGSPEKVTDLYWWLVSDYGQTLNNWLNEDPIGFSFDTPQFLSKFGKCNPEAKRIRASSRQPAVSGSCYEGGRTGYSVKLVSKGYLQSSQELGNVSGAGTILNPPDSALFGD